MTATVFRLITDGRILTEGGPLIRVPYKLVGGYPKIHATIDNISTQEQYIIRALDVTNFFLESLPYATWWEAPKTRSQNLPQPWRLDTKKEPPRSMPGVRKLYTVDLSFEPLSPDLPADPLQARYFLTDVDGQRLLLGGDEGQQKDAIADPTWAETYQDCYLVTINYDVYQNTFRHTMNVGGQFLAVDSHETYYAEIPGVEHEIEDEDDDDSWKFEKAVLNRDIPLPMYINRPTVEHTLYWPWIKDPNFTEINKQLGKVNTSRFPLLNDADPNTCLFTGYRHRRINTWIPSIEIQRDGGRSIFGTEIAVYEMEFHFSEMATVVFSEDEDGNEVRKTYGHNHVYDTHQNKWVYVTRNDANEPIYQKYDFTEALEDWPGVKEESNIQSFFE